MNTARLAGAFVALGLFTALSVSAADEPIATPDGATIFRVFLNDGTALLSYGEFARVEDRVVFSMPTAASTADPRLHLVNISATHVDWDRTTRYAESARAQRYLATMAESHYAMLTAEIGQALNDLSVTPDAAGRLAIVERARKTLSDWPIHHFNYKQAEISQIVATLDEAIAELRAAAGLKRFDLSFVASVEAPSSRESLLPMPTPKETIEQTLAAARLSDSPAERVSLMAVVLASIDRDADVLPSDWRTITRRTTRASIAAELETDRVYQAFTSQTLRLATERARDADVRGIERLIAQIKRRDQEMGAKRPDSVGALIASVEAELDAARHLRLERDRWLLRRSAFRAYQASISAPMRRLDGLRLSLEDIKALAGSAPDTLASIQRRTSLVLKAMSAIVPPDEFLTAHALLTSAAQLADSAASIRREAVLRGNLTRAWDASAAAAGALMLTARGQSEMQAVVRLPQLSR